ncbi:hypothetical protein KAI92_00725 [Candidatus Parcubacteria bacterium]|nr:hypothetical protein [Candidatus Parcubacteria bacterium]
MVFDVITSILKDEKKEFKNKSGESVVYRVIRVMNTKTDDNVTEISVNQNFGELPMKESVCLTLENKESFGKVKFHLQSFRPYDVAENKMKNENDDK